MTQRVTALRRWGVWLICCLAVSGSAAADTLRAVAMLQLLPLTISSFTLNLPQLLGGSPSTATVRLAAPAPPGARQSGWRAAARP